MAKPEKTLKFHNLACPDCGRDDQLRVDVRATIRIRDDENEVIEIHGWEDDENAVCGHPDCDWSGKVWELEIENQHRDDEDGDEDDEAQGDGVQHAQQGADASREDRSAP